MKLRNLLLAMVSGLLVMSCDNEIGGGVPPVEVQENVSFHAAMKNVSRATETTFEPGDKIVVYAVEDKGYGTVLQESGNYADHVEYSYNGNQFVNEESGIVQPTEYGVRYFAIYPSQGVYAAPVFNFTVKDDQASYDNYTKSDLCSAISEVTAEKEVDLVFSHRLSHVIVNLQGENLGASSLAVELNNVSVQCEADINANSFVATGSKASVNMADNGSNSFKAIIVPQTVKAGTDILSVFVDGKEHVLETVSDIRFLSGKQMVFDLLIVNDEIVSFAGSILPWDEESVVEQIIPEYIRIKMEPYIPIYEGVNPPNVEGCYLIDPMQSIYMEDYDGDCTGLKWNSEYLNLTNQNQFANTIDMEELSVSGNAYSAGEGAIIVGEGNNFSILFNTEGYSSDIYTRTVMLLSGTKVETGIKDLKYAFVMVEKGDDPENIIMDEGVFRVFQDQDYLAYTATWPWATTRVAEWVPAEKRLFDIHARIAK